MSLTKVGCTPRKLILFGITNVHNLIDTAVVRRFSLKYSVDAYLSFDDFCAYIKYLSEPIRYSPDVQDLKRLYDCYKQRELKSGDIKAFYKEILIGVICNNEDFSIRDKLFSLFNDGFSTDEHLSRTYGEFLDDGQRIPNR
jgi:hypothetical protein